jgi:hypothetical protein
VPPVDVGAMVQEAVQSSVQKEVQHELGASLERMIDRAVSKALAKHTDAVTEGPHAAEAAPEVLRGAMVDAEIARVEALIAEETAKQTHRNH